MGTRLPSLRTKRRGALCGEPLDEAVALWRQDGLLCNDRHAQRYELKGNLSFEIDID